MILNYDAVRTSGPMDCGLCVLSGITGLDKQTIVDKYKGKWEGMSYCDMLTSCWMLFADGHITWIVDRLPQRQHFQSPEFEIFGNPSWQ